MGQRHDKKCIQKRCRRFRSPRGAYCFKHEHQRRIEKDPVFYYYGVFRRNARRRKKEFLISFEYYREFGIKNGVFSPDGRTKYTNKTIDRRIDALGYVEGNLQVLSRAGNTRKSFVDYWAAQEATRELSDEEKQFLETRRALINEELEQQNNESNRTEYDTDVPF